MKTRHECAFQISRPGWGEPRNCKAPATLIRGGKWYCVKHAAPKTAPPPSTLVDKLMAILNEAGTDETKMQIMAEVCVRFKDYDNAIKFVEGAKARSA